MPTKQKKRKRKTVAILRHYNVHHLTVVCVFFLLLACFVVCFIVLRCIHRICDLFIPPFSWSYGVIGLLCFGWFLFFLLCFSVNCYNGVRFLVTIQHVCVIINVCNDFCINSCFNGLNSLCGACFTCASTLILRMKLVVYSNKITCISSWSSKYIYEQRVCLRWHLSLWCEPQNLQQHTLYPSSQSIKKEKKKTAKR